MASAVIDTPIGQMRAVWSAAGWLQACNFIDVTFSSGVNNLRSAVDSASQKRHNVLVEALSGYFATGLLQWDLAWLDWSQVPAFHGRVLRQCYAIPAGKTLTYGELAARSGSPRAARAVGAAMAQNPWPILIPCHRVVGSDGRLTGYSGCGGLETKRRLLMLESGECTLAHGVTL